MPEPQKPDAVYITAQSKPMAGGSVDRIQATVAKYKPVLGGQPWISEVDQGYIVRLQNPDGSFPTKYGLGGSPKYRWVEIEPGVEYGYLLDSEKGESGT